MQAIKTIPDKELRHSVYATERLQFSGFSIEPGERMTIAANQNIPYELDGHIRVVTSDGAYLLVRLESVEVR